MHNQKPANASRADLIERGFQRVAEMTARLALAAHSANALHSLVTDMEHEHRQALEARIREADTASTLYRTEQETSAALRGELNEARAELDYLRAQMRQAAALLVVAAKPADNKQAA